MKKTKIVTVFFLILTLFTACRKDDVSPQNIENIALETIANRVTIEQAKAIFYHREVENEILNKNSSFNFNKSSDCFNIHPIWELAREVETVNDKGLTIVPIKMPKDFVAHGRGAQLIFYPDKNCTTPVELVFYEGYQYDQTRPFEIENAYFKGFVSIFNLCDCTSLVFPVNEGEILAPQAREFLSEDCHLENTAEERDFWPKWLAGIFNSGGPDCPSFGSSFWNQLGNFFSGIWNGISGVFSGNGSANGSNGNTNWQGSWINFSYTGFPYYNSSGGASGGGGNAVTFNNLFESSFFNGEGQLVIDLLNELIAEYDLQICPEQLHQMLHSCINNNQDEYISGPPPPPGEAISLNAYLSILSTISSSMPCLSSVISAYSSDVDMEGNDGSLLCYLQSQNTFDIEPIDLLQIMKNECDTSAVCHENLVDCFNRLDDFQQEYQININANILGVLLNYCSECSNNSCIADAYYLNHAATYLNSDLSHNAVTIEEPDYSKPAISPDNLMCHQLFEFNFTSDEENRSAAGLKNLRFRLEINGEINDYVIDNLHFIAFPDDNCLESLDYKAANAINKTVISAVERIQNNDYPPFYDDEDNLLAPSRTSVILAELGKNFADEIKECTPADSYRFSDVRYMNNSNAENHTILYNTIFTDFASNYETICE